MTTNESKLSTSRLSRRAFNRGVASATGAGLALGSGIAPAFAQGKRELVYGMWGGAVGNLSPVIRHDNQAGILIYNLFDGLVRPNYAKGTIEPLVAEAWSNPDPLTWRIKMREGIKWQAGYGEVTASDLAYTWQVHLDTKSWQVRTSLPQVDSFKTDGKYVLEVKLKQPLGAFPGITMGYGGLIVPESAPPGDGQTTRSASTRSGTAPSCWSRWWARRSSSRRTPTTGNPGLPHMDRVVAPGVPRRERAPAIPAQGRESILLSHPDNKDVPEVAQNPDFVTHSTPGWNWDYQHFNLSANKDMAYHDKLVRQAISYAIDREAIKQEIYHGQATETDNAIPPGFLGHRESLLKYPRNGDLAKAKDLMAQAGVAGYEVEVMCSDKDWLRRELELVAAMVSQVGINYRIRNLDIGTFNNLWSQQPRGFPADAGGHHDRGSRPPRHGVLVPAQRRLGVVRILQPGGGRSARQRHGDHRPGDACRLLSQGRGPDPRRTAPSSTT